MSAALPDVGDVSVGTEAERTSAHVVRMSRRRLVLGICVVELALGAYGPTAPWATGLTAIGAPVAMAIGVHRYRPKVRWTWLMIITAFVLFLIDGVERTNLHTLGNLTASRSLLPDLIAIPGYVCLASGLFGFVYHRSRKSNQRVAVVYDAVIAALAILAICLVYVIQPVLSDHGTPRTIQIIMVMYPALSIFILTVCYQIAFRAGHVRTEAETFVFFASFMLFCGDMLYMLAELHILAPTPQIPDLPYLVSYVLASAAALDPSMVRMATPATERYSHWSPIRILIVGVGLITPALLLLQIQNLDRGSRLSLFIIAVLLSGFATLQVMRALYYVERSESRLRYQAMHDSLTGLPNRRFMELHLERVLERLLDTDLAIAVLFLDLDRFKLINDTLGHAHGDALLIQVARRLQANVRPSDLVARIGGDEFVVVIGEPIAVDRARDFANRLRTSLRAPFDVFDLEFVVSASIGLAFAGPRDGVLDVETLVREADTAMYQAKEGGRNSVAVYEESMRTRVTERVELERDLRYAVTRHELHLVYQPIISMGTKDVLGVEALIRWAHPTFGVLLPKRFIPLAEETDLINEIGSWVIEEAVRQVSTCRKLPGMTDLSISVNLSVAQLRDKTLAQRVGRVLATYGLTPSALCLELTESEVMKNPEAATEALIALKGIGVRLAIDDFGTEYSSLSYLQRLPFDLLKIDRSFVDPLHEGDPASESLIAAILAMANALNIDTIVEGVETIEQAHRLQQLGCSAAQGFLYARPARVDQLSDVLALLHTRVDELDPVVNRLAIASYGP